MAVEDESDDDGAKVRPGTGKGRFIPEGNIGGIVSMSQAGGVTGAMSRGDDTMGMVESR